MCDDVCVGEDCWYFVCDVGQFGQFDCVQLFEFFGVDYCGEWCEWYCVVCVVGVVVMWDYGQVEFEVCFDQVGDFGFGIGCQYDEWVFDVLVGCVGYV